MHSYKQGEKLEDVFTYIGRKVISKYDFVYVRSDQILNDSIQLKYEIDVERIKD
ncbi:MAG: hypothetical protein ABF321_11260 [Bacteroidia bacterium]